MSGMILAAAMHGRVKLLRFAAKHHPTMIGCDRGIEKCAKQIGVLPSLQIEAGEACPIRFYQTFVEFFCVLYDFVPQA